MNAQNQSNFGVLVVDDDKPTAMLVARVLLRAGQLSRLAHSSQSAIALLQNQRFEMVVLDYLLGDANCWSVLDAAQKSNPPVPVVVVTGRGSEQIAVDALRHGAADYVIK